MIRLLTDRMLIRDHALVDFESYHELLSSHSVMFRHSETSQSLEQSEKRLMQAIEQIDLPENERKLYFFRMEDRLTSEYIGEIGYNVTKFLPVGKLIGVGYFVREKY